MVVVGCWLSVALVLEPQARGRALHAVELVQNSGVRYLASKG